MQFRFRPLILAVLTLSVLWLPATAQTPTEEASFTSALASRFSEQLPEAQVSVKGPLTLAIALSKGGEYQVNLDRVWAFCQRNAPQCEAATTDYVVRFAGVIRDAARPPDPSALKVSVRPGGYIQSAQKQMGGAPGTEPVAAQLVGDIWWVVVIDTPQATRVLRTKDLAALGMNQEQALDIARRNVEPTLKTDVAQALPLGSIGTITGGYFESSRLLFPDKWAGIAAGMKGPLLVVAPSPEMLLYADGGEPHAADTLATLAAEQAQRSQRPLPPIVLRWTPGGWQIAR